MRTSLAAIAALVTLALIAGACARDLSKPLITAATVPAGFRLADVSATERCVAPDASEDGRRDSLARSVGKQDGSFERYVADLPQSTLDQLALSLRDAHDRLGVKQRVPGLMRRILWLMLQEKRC